MYITSGANTERNNLHTASLSADNSYPPGMSQTPKALSLRLNPAQLNSLAR